MFICYAGWYSRSLNKLKSVSDGLLTLGLKPSFFFCENETVLVDLMPTCHGE